VVESGVGPPAGGGNPASGGSLLVFRAVGGTLRFGCPHLAVDVHRSAASMTRMTKANSSSRSPEEGLEFLTAIGSEP